MIEVTETREFKMDIVSEKEKIRTLMRKKLKEQFLKERERKSKLVALKLKKDESFQNAKRIMFYFSTGEEVQTKDLILTALAEGKQVVLPYLDPDSQEIKPSRVRNIETDLQKGTYGIMESREERLEWVDPNEIDLVLVPALAFDHAKYRLGRGKGYYDRFLAKLPRKVRTFGLAFDFQILETIPVTELDIPVHRLFHN